MQDVKQVYEIRSDFEVSCPVCHDRVVDRTLASTKYDESAPVRVNHMLEAHGWRLLHVGSQTVDGVEGGREVATVYSLCATEDSEPLDRREPAPEPDLD